MMMVNMRLGLKIRQLRKQKGISQEVLAQYLGVTFQSVSKWEKGAAMPDVAAIPAIAAFFGVSTDELFDFDRLAQEERVTAIVKEAVPFRTTDPARYEAILREGLRQYPGNDILLNNLLYVMDVPDRREEAITLCRSLIEGTKDDAVKYDAVRILAETYHAMGEYALCKQTLEDIPEIYFTKLHLQSEMLNDEDAFFPAAMQRDLAAEMLVDTILRLADCYEHRGDTHTARIKLHCAANVIRALQGDTPDGEHWRSFCDDHCTQTLAKIEQRLAALP